MKKSRPGFLLTVLAKPEGLSGLSSIIFSETTTIGVRFYEAGRFILSRKSVRVKTEYGRINVKQSRGPDGICTSSPEYEDCVRIAKSRRVPLKTVYEAASAAAR